MSKNIIWYNDFLGIAYRYFDLRMNIILLFSDKKKTSAMWHKIIRWWNDPFIRIRFIEDDKYYWFIMDGSTKYIINNKSFYKVLLKSNNYNRFKTGCFGEAYLRLATYYKKDENNSQDNDVCNCNHTMKKHDITHNICLIANCNCKKFLSFQLNMIKKHKLVTDIAFMSITDIKNDSLAWNCVYVNSTVKI